MQLLYRPVDVALDVRRLRVDRAVRVVRRPDALALRADQTAVLGRVVVNRPSPAGRLAGRDVGPSAFAVLHLELPPLAARGEPLRERAGLDAVDERPLRAFDAVDEQRPRAGAAVGGVRALRGFLADE